MKEVKSKVLGDLIKMMGERSVSGLKDKKIKAESEMEVEVSPKDAVEKPDAPSINVHIDGTHLGGNFGAENEADDGAEMDAEAGAEDKPEGKKKKLDKIFG